MRKSRFLLGRGVAAEAKWRHDCISPIPLLMFLNRLTFSLLLGLACVSLWADEPTPSPSERIQRVYSFMDPKAPKSVYQGKTFDAGGGTFNKTFKTDDYAGVKEFGSKPFLTRTFEGAKKSWIGHALFHEKKLPENLQGANRDATKQFGSKEVPLKNYGDLDKKSGFADKEAFATREIKPKGSSQGAIDNDQHLQEQIKKGLSIDDVRKLLNKPL